MTLRRHRSSLMTWPHWIVLPLSMATSQRTVLMTSSLGSSSRPCGSLSPACQRELTLNARSPTQAPVGFGSQSQLLLQESSLKGPRTQRLRPTLRVAPIFSLPPTLSRLVGVIANPSPATRSLRLLFSPTAAETVCSLAPTTQSSVQECKVEVRVARAHGVGTDSFLR